MSEEIILTADGREVAIGDEAWVMVDGKPIRQIVEPGKKLFGDYLNCLMSNDLRKLRIHEETNPQKL